MLSYYLTYMINNAFIIVTGMLGVYVITGLTGMFSLGQAAFMAIGGYTAGMLSKFLGWPFWLTIPSAIVAGAILGFLVGIPVIRLRRDYVAVVSLGFSQALVALLNNSASITGGALGLSGIPRYTNKPIIVIALIAIIAIIWQLKKSRFGRQCIAIKVDELAAASMGIDVSRVKLTVFILACAISAFAGCLYVHTTSYLDSASFGWDQSSLWIIMVYFGGVSSLTGSVLSGIVLTMIPEIFRFSSEWRTVIYCIIVLIIINFRPQGLMGETELDGKTFRKIGKTIASVPAKLKAFGSKAKKEAK